MNGKDGGVGGGWGGGGGGGGLTPFLCGDQGRCAQTEKSIVGRVDMSANSSSKVENRYITGVVCASVMSTDPPTTSEPAPSVDSSAKVMDPVATVATVTTDAAANAPGPAEDPSAVAQPATDAASAVDPAQPSEAQKNAEADAARDSAKAESIEAMNRATEMIKVSARTAHEAQQVAERLRRENAELVAAKAKADADLLAEKAAAEKRARDHEADRHMQTLRCLQETLSACGGGAGADLSMLASKDPDERDRLIASTAISMAAQADSAIKGMTQSSQKKAQEMDSHIQGAKRARDEANAAKTKLYDVTRDLQHFGGEPLLGYILPRTSR